MKNLSLRIFQFLPLRMAMNILNFLSHGEVSAFYFCKDDLFLRNMNWSLYSIQYFEMWRLFHSSDQNISVLTLESGLEYIKLTLLLLLWWGFSIFIFAKTTCRYKYGLIFDTPHTITIETLIYMSHTANWVFVCWIRVYQNFGFIFSQQETFV